MTEKNLYIIAGCNGAGKTTAAFTILPEILLCKEFINADEIARGLSPFQPETVAFEAGRIMLNRIDELLKIMCVLLLRQHFLRGALKI
jgi:predicted ABC-type ATPase